MKKELRLILFVNILSQSHNKCLIMSVKLTQTHFSFNTKSDKILPILVFYASTYFVYQDFDIPLTVGFLIVTLFIVVNAMIFPKIKTNMLGGALILLNAAVLIQYIRPDANLNVDTIMCLLTMLMFSVAAIFAKPDETVIKNTINAVKTVALVFVTYVVFFTIFRTVFIDYIYPILSKPSQLYYDRFLPRGFNPCVGASYTYTDYIIVLGIASVCADLFNPQRTVKNKKNKWLLIYFLLGMFLVQRRGELVAICITLWLLWIIVSSSRKRIKIICITIFSVVLAIGAIYIAFPIIKHWDALSRYIRTIELWQSGQDVTSGRTQLYMVAHQLFNEHPILGIGWKQFDNYVPLQFRDIHGDGERVIDVHNNYLQFLCETGVIGFAMIMVPMLVLIVSPIKTLLLTFKRRYRDSVFAKEIVQTSIFAIVIQLFFFVVGFLDPCFYKSYFWCFYGLSVIFAIYSHNLKMRMVSSRV